MIPPKLLLPRENIAQIGPLVGPSPLLSAVLEIPGARIVEDGATFGNLELPRNTWTLPEVQRFCAEQRLDTPVWRRPPPNVASSFLRDYQSGGVSWLLQNEGGLLGDQMGLGKQHAVDTRVLTPTGWRLIGDLRVGDSVIGSNGQRTEVLGVYPQGIKASYRVKFSDGAFVEAGAEHLWTVAYRCGGKRWEELILTTEQMRSGAQLGKLSLAKTPLYLPLLSAPVEFDDPGPLPVPPYTLGQLIANGCLGNGTPKLVTNAVDWTTVAARLREEGAWKASSIRIYGSVVHTTFPGLLSALRNLELCCGSRDKFVPSVYHRAPAAARIALLQGLMDADGSISKTRNRVTYHTTSVRLAEDVRELVEGLGGIATVRVYDRTAEEKPTEYQVRVRTPRGIAPFSVLRKLSRWRPGSHATPRRTFVGAEYVRDVASVCIWVAAEDQLYVTERCIVTHNSRQAAIAAELRRANSSRNAPVVIIGPKFLRQTWLDELKRIGAVTNEETEFCALRGVTLDRALFNPYAKYFFCHYDIVRAWWTWLWPLRPSAVIIDEAQALKNSQTIRAKTVAQAVSVCSMRIVLTGTPLANRLGELWNLLNLAEGKWSFGAPNAFRRRYIGAYYDGHGLRDGRPTNTAELQERLRCCYLRRTLADVKLELPAVTRQVIEVPFTDEQAAAYKDILGNRDPREIARALIQRRVRKDTLKLINAIRKLTSRAKLDATVTLAQSHVGEGLGVVVFTWERKTAEHIARGVLSGTSIDGHVIHGGLSQIQRDAAVRRFQEWPADSPTGPLLVATLDSLSVGVNLQRGRVVIMHDLDWTPSVLLQAEARVWRQGQRYPVTSQWMVVERSLDQLLAKHLQAKGDVIQRVLDDSHGADLAEVLGPSAAQDFEVELVERAQRWRAMREAWR